MISMPFQLSKVLRFGVDILLPDTVPDAGLNDPGLGCGTYLVCQGICEVVDGRVFEVNCEVFALDTRSLYLTVRVIVG